VSTLRPLLDLLSPAVRSALAEDNFQPSSYATPLAVATLSLDHERLLVVVATTSDAEALRDGVAAYLGDDVALLPGWDIHPMERVSPDVEVMGARQLLRGQWGRGEGPRVVVAPVRAVTQVTATPPDTPLVIRSGDRLDRDEVVEQLAAWGYRREAMVEHRAEFSVRGGIVDVWPSNDEEPLRLDFFGDEVERVVRFDVSSQRATDDVAPALIVPAREWIPSPDARRRAEEMSRGSAAYRDVMDRLASGHLFDGMEGWQSVLETSRRTIIDEFPGEIVVVEPDRVNQRLDDLLDEERELADTVGATWGLDEGSLLLHEGPENLARATRTLRPGRGDAHFLVSPPVAQGDPSRIAAHVRGWSRARRGVILTSNPAAVTRMADQLRAEGLDVTDRAEEVLTTRLSVLYSTLPAGFSCDDPELVVWAESDLTGRRSVHRAPRVRSRASEAFFEELAVQSYVVHRQHGVARFEGITTQSIDGAAYDYLILQFRDGQSLWPVDQIDELTPYSGGDAPSLSRLGGAEWQKTRAKAAASAWLVAQDLVDLYRQRLATPGFAFSPDTSWQKEMEDLFPYALTTDQARAIAEIKTDMEAPRPMDRLVCADVGFGKTEIAVRAVFKAVQDHKQAAVLVPTTLLASQHFATFTERYAGFPVKVALLSRFVEPAEAERVRQGLADGTIDVVIGTHRLLSEQITFHDLGLLVVDEEQRFGVDHKEAIKKKTVGVDVLTLSASPIPRTLEMAFTGIRDLSMVTTPPADRRPILTHVGEYSEPAVVEAIRRELLREGQVFFVHNRVNDIDETARRIGQMVPDARIAIAHGQMDEGTLERIMVDFWERRYDVLVCTTIVESGIDLPTVNTMIVDRADRLGLGQLHQLRGRVGRSGQRAYAYLFHPAGQTLTEAAYERLRTIGDNNALGSGFKIAMRDLEIRGAGNLLGQEQSGVAIAAVGYDLYVQLVAEAVADAKGIEVRPAVAPVTLEVPVPAHLPESYVQANDARLEAYRRLASIESLEKLEDLRSEWQDRYGSLPQEADSLLDLAALRLECAQRGISALRVDYPRSGLRSTSIIKVSPLEVPLSSQMRLRRLYGERAYDETAKEVRIEMAPRDVTVSTLRDLLNELAPSL
jgi:transcription-repair coupling factor (superfamily II helicase)